MYAGKGLGFAQLVFGLAAVTGATGCSAAAAGSPRMPAVAFAASTDDVSDGCRIEGMPVVIATHVAPRGGVSATADGSLVWLRFGTTRDGRIAVALDPESLEIVDGGRSPDPVAAGLTPGLTPGPLELDLTAGRHLVAWTDGSLTDGMRVRALTVDDRGRAVGDEINLGYEGSAIGRPAAAIAPSGHGVLAFIESNGAGFQLVVARTRCMAA